jgi:transcriptional regulator GlxA family with amidase domain
MPDKNNSDKSSETHFLQAIAAGRPVAFEKHYSVRELAAQWNLSERTIRRMFAGEPGVVEWGQDETRSKRTYKTLRIPESVAQRVHRKLRKAS